MVEENQYDINSEPLVISKSVIDLLLKNKKIKPGDLIAHYIFYYYTAKWQKTNQVKATNSYVSQGMKIGESKTRRIKKELIDLGLLEDIIIHDKKGRVNGHYIKVNFIWSKEKIKRRRIHPTQNKQGGEKTTLSVLPGVEKKNPNALSTSKVNALSTGIDKNLINFVLEFFDIQKKNHPNILKKDITKSQCIKQAKVVSDLTRLDSYNFKTEIKPAILWATDDSFWTGNLLSLASLRTRSKSNDLIKFQNILSKYLESGNKKPRSGNKLSESSRKKNEEFMKGED